VILNHHVSATLQVSTNILWNGTNLLLFVALAVCKLSVLDRVASFVSAEAVSSTKVLDGIGIKFRKLGLVDFIGRALA